LGEAGRRSMVETLQRRMEHATIELSWNNGKPKLAVG
jgi:hypothetical protein